MIYRLILFALIFIIKTSYSNVIYDKNDVLITDIEMNNYIDLFENNFGNSISKNEAIKKIVLIKKTIIFLQKNNPDFLSKLDTQIEKEFTKEIFNNKIILNFIRFQKTRNEFITEYFNKNFSIKELENIFSNFDSVKIPISKNNCLTIERLYEVNKDQLFIKDFFENVKKSQQNYEIIIDGEKYNGCINNEIYSKLEKEIINYIKNETEEGFNNFIYGKAN